MKHKEVKTYGKLQEKIVKKKYKVLTSISMVLRNSSFVAAVAIYGTSTRQNGNGQDVYLNNFFGVILI